MTGKTPTPARGIRSQPPPAWLMRHIANPVVRLIARSPLARWTGSLTVLTFTTRRTERQLRIPVLAHQVGPSLLVFTDARWAANFRDQRPVTLIRRGRRHHGQASLSDDFRETSTALRAVLQQVATPRRLGLTIDKQYQPTDDDLAALRRMIRISI
ncbi:MAG: hypothetical protein QOE61_2458 [Micromonosporaceae bacterium]|nr:hypothetical protein [Micromonosporaceae bacterium]